jgi:hypothetical protein
MTRFAACAGSESATARNAAESDDAIAGVRGGHGVLADTEALLSRVEEDQPSEIPRRALPALLEILQESSSVAVPELGKELLTSFLLQLVRCQRDDCVDRPDEDGIETTEHRDGMFLDRITGLRGRGLRFQQDEESQDCFEPDDPDRRVASPHERLPPERPGAALPAASLWRDT